MSIKSIFAAAAAVALALPSIAGAQAATPTAVPLSINTGAIVMSSDGKLVGKIQRIFDADGEASTVSVIYRSQFVQIPASTLTADDKRFITSLTLAEIKKLK